MRVKIEFEVEVANVTCATEQELEDFLRFTFRDNGYIDSKNPFYVEGKRCEPIFGTFEWQLL